MRDMFKSWPKPVGGAVAAVVVVDADEAGGADEPEKVK